MFPRKGSEIGNIGNDGFDVKILSEKLSKLNNSQRIIKSLSHWCISNQNKARQIVETWEKSFNSCQKGQCISFLYLANEILQNSRRNGTDFVNEFWNVLPVALRQVYENGDESGKKEAARLVGIWEDKKFFGSRVLSLKDGNVTIHPKNPGPQVASNEKAANPIKIMKKDAQSLSIKLSVGGYCEKIVSAFHSLYDECSNEESLLSKCKEAALSVEGVVKEVITTISQGNLPGIGIVVKMEEHENVLQQCVRELEGVEASRASLVSLLNEVVKDQELRLETLRGQLKTTRSQMNDVGNLKSNLSSYDQSVSVAPISASTEPPPTRELQNPNFPSKSLRSSQSQQTVNVENQQTPPVSQITTSFETLTSATNEKSKKAVVAAVADKLVASTSSAQMLMSVLSSFVAEQAPSMNNSLRKRPKLEQPPFSGADPTHTDRGSSSYFTPHKPLISTNQVSQSRIQASMGPPAPLSLPPMNSTPNRFPQSYSMMSNVIPSYGFGGGSTLPPPQPSFSHVAMGLAGPHAGPQNSKSGPQQNSSDGFYYPSGFGLYGSVTHPSTPPVNRK